MRHPQGHTMSNAQSKLEKVEEGVAVGPRPVESRLSLEWLLAAGVIAGIASTVAMVRHYDAHHGPIAELAEDLPQAIQASRPRFVR